MTELTGISNPSLTPAGSSSVTQDSSSPVNDAVDLIERKLDERGLLNDVTHSELQDINRTLEQLTSDQTNEVISRLSDSSLAKWGGEIYSSGWFGSGGLSVDERLDLFTNLAKDLGAAQLERVYLALGDGNRQMELGDAIASSSDATKADFIARIADDTTDKPNEIGSGLGAVTINHWDKDARVVSHVLGSMSDPSAIEQALGNLGNKQLEGVLNASIHHSSIAPISDRLAMPAHIFDTKGLQAIIDAAGNSGDAALKARVFEYASRQIDEIRNTDGLLTPNILAGNRAGEVADALSGLIDTDTVGIISALERGDGAAISRAGNGISSYMEELVRQNDMTQIQELIAKLQSGNDLEQDPAEYLSSFTVDSHGVRDFQNASNLGFLIGGVREGIAAIEKDAKDQAELLSTIFGTAFGLGGIAAKPITQVALVIAEPLTEALVSNIASDLRSNNMSLGDALEQLALPDNIYSSDVTGPFGDAIDNVTRN